MEFKGTKGKWESGSNGRQFVIAPSVAVVTTFMDFEEQEANAELIADAGNVRQQIDFSLTELLEKYNKLNDFVKEVEKETKQVIDLLSREGIDDCNEARSLDELWFSAHEYNNQYQ